MNIQRSFLVAVIPLAGALIANGAAAADIPCKAVSATINYMQVSDTTVSACLDAGVGNLTGNPANDLFLNGAGAGQVPAGKSDGTNPFNISFSQTSSSGPTSTGTFSFDSSFWDNHNIGSIGFKFGTGNKPDEWFVYSLVNGVSSGEYTFFNVNGTGGGLSHVNLYSDVPLPAAVWLFGSALLGFAGVARKKKSSSSA